MRYPALIVASAAVAWSGGADAPRAAGNAWTFAHAESAAVDYRATPFRASAECRRLGEALADGASVTSARLVPAEGDAPEHCRVDGVIPKEIGFQVNLPVRWNGRLYMYGNGGYAGEDAEAPGERRSRALGLAHGFATARTDTGHLAAREPLGSFARDPDKLVDHGYRAVHETVQVAKRLVQAFYGRVQDRAYWDGCSTGGRQGVMAAERYPADFDGIVATAPTLRWSPIMAKGLSNQRALDGSRLTIAKMKTVFAAVLDRCDAADGLKDGLVAEPATCDFDPGRHLPRCTAGSDGAECFSDREVEGLRQIYSGPTDAAGHPVFVGQYPGSEDSSTIGPFVLNPDGAPNLLFTFAQSWMRDLAFRDRSYDWRDFEPGRDMARMAPLDAILDPKPDLAAFAARGGKMITWWGLADNALNPQMGLRFYDALVDRDGLEATRSYYRFFGIPGVAHCRGGYGPGEVDALSALVDWVERGRAPERLPARLRVDGAVKYDRAYCPYPQLTRHSGQGDPEDPANVRCVGP